MNTKLPKTFDEAIAWVLTDLDPRQQADLKAIPEDDLCTAVHMCYAMRVRNELIYMNPHADDLINAIYGTTLLIDPDTVSADIVNAVWDTLNGQEPRTPVSG